jgi:hypothetical protein
MARTGITYKQVAQAATSITARGEDPTLKSIRDELGGEGSFTTISKFLKQWHTEQADKEPDPELPPAEIQNAFMDAAMTAWHTATRTYNVNLAAMKHAHEQETKKLKGDNDAMLADLSKLETELADANTRCAKLTAADEEKGRTMAALESELETTKRLYAELVASLRVKQPGAAQGKKASDTKSERPAAAGAAPEGKQP